MVLTVLLPEAEGSTDSDAPKLPDTIEVPVELTAMDVTAGKSGAEVETAETQGELYAKSAEELETIFGAEAAVRSYSDEQQQVQLTVTAVAVEAGAYTPAGPPVDAALLGLERSTRELVKVGEGVCAVYWSQPVAEGQELPDEQPSGLQCQLGADGTTWLLEGVGLDPEEAIEVLENLAA